MLPTEAEVKPYLGQGHPYDFGFVAGMSRLIMAHAEIAPFFGGLFRQIMFQEGTLTRREREMVAAVAAAAQDCFY
jgi:alkylhydroperoxidase/carboxymuconolactone decarboxylase family protein YurZ